jgi:hypothetical protein
MADLNPKRPEVFAFDYPDWQPEYRAAILETDRAHLKEKIDAAETAIFRRVQVLTTRANDPEREAMKDATRALRVLLVKELGYPSFSK